MGNEKFKLIREDEKVGVWFEQICYLRAMKHIKNRNKKLYNYFKDRYENLTEKKFNEEELRNI